MFSGRGYCTQPTCFPVLGAPPILVFFCHKHCRHMLCYRHWLSHQTSPTNVEDHSQDIDHFCSNSDRDEQETVPDLLKECTNQEEQPISEEDFQPSVMSDEENNEEMIELPVYEKEIEWWNEITPWKNSENFNVKPTSDSFDHEDDDSDYETGQKRKSSRKKLARSLTSRAYSDVCPLTFDGAFGLVQSQHQHQLCSTSTKKICLYQHFHSKHGFTGEVSIRLVRAIIRQQDPVRIKLFSSSRDTPSTLFDPYHKVKCPLSTREGYQHSKCVTQEITRKSIRRHLAGVHRLDQSTINQLMKDMIK